ncbi:hypothetical protein Psal071_02446 [Piscirickettsia salmonis]|uniref:Uncharacterized protein n=1 Tax=Piscirickettsia salmonis TaxID=1238 RepID=A0A9Q6LL54_PISSA|nr:hypothetical protein KW89_2309 [Piscirickettsia salmonis]QGN78214.1 hypothetical protein Psal001_02446 [Piscirickettsia salmonis]QGN81794.1 hypothetical protein Psal002_02461 [Piscirickettsia salmonis]QGN83933.1 hypothetical protein Psal003_00970 [Piscirickettsia salmonis]QGN87444.1 hypothetical protein Psal004_00967 [Piscirickettsia salmonis]
MAILMISINNMFDFYHVKFNLKNLNLFKLKNCIYM